MKKLLLIMALALLIPSKTLMANEYINNNKPTAKQFKMIDKQLEERLNLSEDQLKYLKINRQKKLKEMERIISQMEETHKKIRNIYMLGLPKYQADIKASPYKMELVLLKQNADSIRLQNRKNFESILTSEQKNEFKKIKQEGLIRQ